MSIKLAAWNAQERLALPNHMPAAVEYVKRLDADVVILSDAYSLKNELHGAQPEELWAAKAEFDDQGYAIFETEYDDTEAWVHDRNLMMLSRIPVVEGTSGVLRLATRNAYQLAVQGDTINDRFHVVGLHLDDRSETTRARQATALAELPATYYEAVQLPEIAAGDFNNIHADKLLAQLFRSDLVRAIAHNIPRARTRSQAERTTEMALGRAIAILEAAGLRDVDHGQKPTYPAGFPFLQLDHIMAAPQVIASKVERPKPSPSDHLAVSAKLSIA